ncbi:MAG: FHA domain-containing protein [Bacteroidia bacterium]|nr:FHA domain-containing protein [Bacteroidia bacterium]
MRMKGYLLIGVLAWAQPADLVILVETSQLTCGRPIDLMRQALRGLCGHSSGEVAIGTFSRLQGGQAVIWLTTPSQPLRDIDGCHQLLDRLRSPCDSIYRVNLLYAVEDAINKGYGSSLLVLTSGRETGRGLTVAEVRYLAKKKGVRLYIASIGWLVNDEATQGFLKQLAGTLEGEEGTLVIIDPTSSHALDRLRAFVEQVWRRTEAAVRQPETSEASLPSVKEETPPLSSVPVWVWIALAGVGTLIALGLVIRLLRPKSTPPSDTVSAPSPTPLVSLAPAPCRLIIYYPHTQQEVTLPSTNVPITIGRASDNAIVITDSTVSSRHARLFLQGNRWYIQDLGSTNGTFVNGQRITQHPIQVGDRIRMGAIVIQVAG